MLVVMRERDNGDPMRFIGEAYVHWLMDGEAVRGVTMDNYKSILNRFRLKNRYISAFERRFEFLLDYRLWMDCRDEEVGVRRGKRGIG